MTTPRNGRTRGEGECGSYDEEGELGAPRDYAICPQRGPSRLGLSLLAFSDSYNLIFRHRRAQFREWETLFIWCGCASLDSHNLVFRHKRARFRECETLFIRCGCARRSRWTSQQEAENKGDGVWLNNFIAPPCPPPFFEIIEILHIIFEEKNSIYFYSKLLIYIIKINFKKLRICKIIAI